MTLQSSGDISLTEIRTEIWGVGATASRSLEEARIESGKISPISMTSFYGYTYPWGRVYSQEDITLGGWMKRETQGDYHSFTGSETLEFTEDRQESIGVYKSNTGTPIVSGDTVRVEIYRRTKQTTDSWTFESGWNNYASATNGPHSILSRTYDYKFVLTNNV